MTSSRGSLPLGLAIRPTAEGDSPAGDLPAVPADQDAPHWRRSVVAVLDDQVVGVAWISLAPATDMCFAEVHVATAHRRRRIGTALFAALCDRTDESYRVCARVMSSQPLRDHFATALGASVLVDYPGPWLEAQSSATRAWAEAQSAPAGVSIDPLSSSPKEAAVEAWTRYVTWAHRPFGVVRVDRVRDQWQEYASSLDPDLSMIATGDAGSVLAFSLVTPDGWQGRTFIVSETVAPTEPDGDALLSATVAASVRAIAGRGEALIELEGHSTDPHSPALARAVPAIGADPMRIVELQRPARAGTA